MLGEMPRSPTYVRKYPPSNEGSCVFRALMRYEVKQHDFKMFEADS
jgi:hypothetical protein